MTANPRFDGPMPPAGSVLGWCALCAAIYKGYAVSTEPLESRVQEVLHGDVQDVLLDLDSADGEYPMLQEAVTVHLLEIPGPNGQTIAAPVPACWSHLRALKILMSGILPAGFVPTGMEPLLGQGRPQR